MTRTQLAETINAFGDARATNNQNLVRLAVAELNHILLQVPVEFGIIDPKPDDSPTGEQETKTE